MSANEQIHPDPRAWEGWQTPPDVPDLAQLDLLAADAAARATALLAANEAGPQGTQGPQQGWQGWQGHDEPDALIDAVRLLASAAGAQHTARAAQLTGIPADDLRRLTLAYRHGGTAGVAAARAGTPCGAGTMAAAVEEVRRRRTFAVGELTLEKGTITDAGAGVLLRLGPDGRWYPFTLARQQWWATSGANASAGAAYQAAIRARSLRRASS
ncbi:MAG: hypothetical protein JXA67_07740 [Micromonosporaceae bacterium]|nr:hypothetical protein [Micromonosporaceae bacterium]